MPATDYDREIPTLKPFKIATMASWGPGGGG